LEAPVSFLKKLFGGAKAPEAAKEHRSEPQEHKGFSIVATPYKEGGQYQLCGAISKEIDGQKREHRFIRADRFADLDTAVEMTILKARQIVDQQGDRIFSQQ
jgi:hypothetical protein